MLLAYEIEDRYMKKLSMQKLSDFLPEGVTDVKELIQPSVRDLQVTPSRMTLLTESPMQCKLAMLSDTLVIDLIHRSKKGPLYNLIGMSTFLEKYDCAFQISQTYTVMRHRNFIDCVILFMFVSSATCCVNGVTKPVLISIQVMFLSSTVGACILSPCSTCRSMAVLLWSSDSFCIH